MDAEIEFEQRGRAGLITLNRPKALNALTHGMAVVLHAQLDLWADDRSVDTIVIKAQGDRAFCAGGDIRALYDWGRAKDPKVIQFYHDEYRLNARIKSYPKPYVALIDGIVMGGGVGVSIHGSHRAFSERAIFAMPETGIGLFPDVGGSYFLPRCPGQMGIYLGLTGARVKVDDALALGLATHAIRADGIAGYIDQFAAGKHPDEVLPQSSAQGPSMALRPLIDQCFSATSMEEILARLAASDNPEAQNIHKSLASKSPTSLKVTLRQLRLGAQLDFADCMRMEYRLTNRFMAGSDFYEGVRAIIIDKDQAPKWQPSDLAAVDDAMVDRYFAPLAQELAL
jgi:enoyl-CoA hydratase